MVTAEALPSCRFIRHANIFSIGAWRERRRRYDIRMLDAHQIEIVDVGPRDGLQNEATPVGTDAKVEFVTRLVAAGVRRIEVASFVDPRRVPQMADAEAVIERLPSDGARYIGLVLNRRGAERALATGVHELGCVCVASDGFAMRNQGQSGAETVSTAAEIVALAHAHGRMAQVTIGAAFGCPFEGEVPARRVMEMVRMLAAAGADEIALADTIGVATPVAVEALVRDVVASVRPLPVRVHFHNTRNTAIANVWAAVSAGARAVDGAAGGLGGCPFAPRATGNVPTEDILYLLHRSGIGTGVSLEGLIGVAGWLSDLLDRPLPGMVSRAGDFPAVRSEM
jgi:hydroxymethylglutaryl-CoA lyase